jgi:N-acetylglucosamine transport system substrate-binding protein
VNTSKTYDRRTIVRGALAAAAVVPLSGFLAACAGSSNDDSGSKSPGGTKSADNPFGMADKATVDAVIFDGGYGTDYGSFSAAIKHKNFAGASVQV